MHRAGAGRECAARQPLRASHCHCYCSGCCCARSRCAAGAPRASLARFGPTPRRRAVPRVMPASSAHLRTWRFAHSARPEKSRPVRPRGDQPSQTGPRCEPALPAARSMGGVLTTSPLLSTLERNKHQPVRTVASVSWRESSRARVLTSRSAQSTRSGRLTRVASVICSRLSRRPPAPRVSRASTAFG